MGSYVPLKITCPFARKYTLFAAIRHFTRVGSHVASKLASFFARVVALCTNKGFLFAVNSHVDFQARRSVA